MSSNPVFNDNVLKVGTFCTNGRGASHTLLPEANRLNWPLAVEVAQAADRAGYEAVVPFARWKGYIKDKPNHVSGNVLDTFTWAASIAQATVQIGVFVTSHAPTMHPILAAKQTATIDIISNGRLALNDDEFDYHGKFFDVIRGISIPKPVQRPGPPIMNAGLSDRGRLFACEHADLCFVGLRSEDFESGRDEVEKYKCTARERFEREVLVWAHTYVVQRETQKEAEDYLQYYAVTNQDRECVDALLNASAQEVHGMPLDLLESLRTRYAAGFGGFPLVGTAERIAHELALLSKAGLNGVLLTWVDYVDGIERFNRQVLPMLEQAGLRRPFKQSV